MKYKSIIRMNQDLMLVIREIICLKDKGWGIRNKSWWKCRWWHTLVALFCNKSEVVYLDSFGVEHVPEEITEFCENKNLIANIFWVQTTNSVMCGCFCIGFIDFMLTGKILTDFTSTFSPYDFRKNNDIILSYFKDGWNW